MWPDSGIIDPISTSIESAIKIRKDQSVILNLDLLTGNDEFARITLEILGLVNLNFEVYAINDKIVLMFLFILKILKFVISVINEFLHKNGAHQHQFHFILFFSFPTFTWFDTIFSLVGPGIDGMEEKLIEALGADTSSC